MSFSCRSNLKNVIFDLPLLLFSSSETHMVGGKKQFQLPCVCSCVCTVLQYEFFFRMKDSMWTSRRLSKDHGF